MSEEWQDRYYPVDFYGKAGAFAKKYCEQHPDADKQTVYYAATEAAEIYESKEKYRKYKFENFAFWRVRNALYMQIGKEKSMTVELKSNIINDVISGVPQKEIAEKYNLNPSTLCNNVLNWQKRGLIPSAAEGIQKPTINKDFEEAVQKMEAEAKKKKSAPPVDTTSVKPSEKPVVMENKAPSQHESVKNEGMVNWLSYLIDVVQERIGAIYHNGKDFDSFEVLTAEADNAKGCAAVSFAAGEKLLSLKLEVLK